MVVERINKTELRTEVCGELEGQERGGYAAERMPRVSEVGSDDEGSPMRRMKPIEAQAASCKLSQTAETCAA